MRLVTDDSVNSARHVTCKIGIFPGLSSLNGCLDELLQSFVIDV